MKPSLLIAIAASFAAGAVASAAAGEAFARPARAAAPAQYVNSTYNFSVTPPAYTRVAKDASHAVSTFFAPARDGFANNLGIMVQNVKTTLEDYAELSRNQFKELGIAQTAETKLKVSGRDAILWEYEGTQAKRKLKWMALAVVDGDRVFLITGTALAADYETVSKDFKASIESFKLLD